MSEHRSEYFPLARIRPAALPNITGGRPAATAGTRSFTS